MESIFLSIAILGFVELIKAANVKDYLTVEIIIGAALIGTIAGLTHIDGLTVVTGLQAGLAAAGTYKVGKLVGGTTA